MKKFARTFDGRTYLYSRKFKNKPSAAIYARRVREIGYNARVVNWAGGSGVYIGNRKYNKTKERARSDWLEEIQESLGEDGFGQALGSMGFQTVPRIKNVGGNIGDARDLRIRAIPPPDGLQYMSTMDKVDSIDQAFSGIENWDINNLIGALLSDEYDDDSSYETADEEALKFLAIKNLKEKRELGVTPSDTLFFLENEDMDLFTSLSAVDENKPILANEKTFSSAAQFEIGGPMRTGRNTPMLGWGVDPGEGRGRFGMNSKNLARWHVVVTYPTLEGYEERPIYAFDTEAKAKEFAEQFKELGSRRGEYFMDKIGYSEGVNTGYFLPFESTEVNIVKESASEDEIRRQDIIDAQAMQSKLNLPPEFDPSRIKSNVPGQEAVREMINSQKSKEYWENYSEMIGLIMYNLGFGIDPKDNFVHMVGSAAENPDYDPEIGYTADAIEEWVDQNFTTDEILNFNAQKDFLEDYRIKRD